MNFADTNWLAAMFFEVDNPARTATVRRFMRTHGGPLGLSHVVYLEARNVFSRNSGEANPEEWAELLAGLNGRFYLDPMNWDFLRREVFGLVERHGHKTTLGTFDLAVLASAKLAGGQRFLSFDETLKAVAVADGMEVFPPLQAEGKALLANLRR